MAERKDKKLIMVPSDLAGELLQLAAKQGKSFSTFIQEDLEQVVRVSRLGYPLKDVVDFFEIMEALKAAGAAFTPQEVLRFLTGEVAPRAREKLEATWYESGRWYGKYLIAKFPDRVAGLGHLLRASRWDLDEVRVARTANSVEIRCISTSLPLEETELLLKFVEGAMHALGYETKQRDCTRGIIDAVFQEATPSRR